eukprot:CAMPEP_0119506590 /NCGR_PEP_ID=MMETSP1344-20130328/26764_1 /TAXON_ID=236787 /ORGANISM="Florenciella parvula, Strain CCMP2471" /LENGTH=68 /DNA_ID=CAMNT_0007543147 /DNA_START=43 /DNA_END=245 /DNA_ORIENTATION=-
MALDSALDVRTSHDECWLPVHGGGPQPTAGSDAAAVAAAETISGGGLDDRRGFPHTPGTGPPPSLALS